MHQLDNTFEKYENPFFIGTVEDNNDPTYNYRVKVRIDQIHSNTVTTDQLPWAAKVDSSFMGIDGSTILHSIPEVGSKVLILAVGNNINSLVYLGCLYKKTNSTPSSNNYLNSYGIFDQNGNFIKLDKVQRLLQLVWAGKIDISQIEEMNIIVNGNVNLTASTTNIKSNVKINGTLDVTGMIKSESDVRANKGSIGLMTHTHPGIFPGPSSTMVGEN